MRICYRLLVLPFAFILWTFTALGQSLQPGYVPPDVVEHGLLAHNQHLAVIQTDCATMDEAVAMRNELTKKGALVSIFTSPQYMLAWVPPEAKNSVLNARLSSAVGTIGVVTVSYNSAEFRSQASVQHTMAVLNEADEAILSYLDFIKQPLTDADKERIRQAEEEMAAKAGSQPAINCVREIQLKEAAPYEIHSGIPAVDLSEPQIMSHASKIRGYVVHTSFFVESKTGTGTWNWDSNVYDRYRNFYIAAINYWSSFTARYGRTVTTHWRLYGPNNSYTQVTGEPTTRKEDVFIPEIVKKFYTPTSSDKPYGSLNAGLGYCLWYNTKIRAAYSADDAVCGFIAYKPTSGEAIWPHAMTAIWGGGEREGVYFALDTQYWQARLDPFSQPLRNVIAHELGHLWGAPDEYLSDNCDWSYRGMKNSNCQTIRPADGRLGYNMRGWDGIMVENYIGGNSKATPVHTGVIPANEAVITRMFLSTPPGIILDFKNCDENRAKQFKLPIGIPMDFDYCYRLVAPEKETISGVAWYFDHWEITRKDGATTTINYYGNTLPSYAHTSTFQNPVKDVRAVFTDSPPDVFTVNTTLLADLAPTGTGHNPPPAVALRWRNKFDMTKASTQIEYEASPDNWQPLQLFDHIALRPFTVPINQWTGVLIYAVPNSSGTGKNAIQPNKEYRFRIVGYFGSNRGTPSQTATITTRPATPADTAYCYDYNEPNSLSTPKVLQSSGPGMAPFSVQGAITIAGLTGEFSWFNPVSDYYRITAINLKSGFFGEVLRLTLRVRPGSNFKPTFRAQRAGQTTHINAVKSNDQWTLTLTTDGEYLIKIEPNISQSISYDLVDRTGGHYAFGEYEFVVERTSSVQLTLPCKECAKLHIVHPFPGELIFNPHPPFPLFGPGLKLTDTVSFNVQYIPPAGFGFLGFGGNLVSQPGNPVAVTMIPNTTLGEYELYPMVEPIDEHSAELVIIYPEGPGGTLEFRQNTSTGNTLIAEAKPPEGYVFVGWGGDSTTTTNPLNVVMWKSKKLIAHYREKPCVPEPMTEWRHSLNFVNRMQSQSILTYAMQPNAGDGLEPDQEDLPPIPPPTAYDIRFINITGSQGSVTDFRAIKPSHIYQGRVQTGPTNPIQMTWPAPPATPNASFTLRIQGVSGSINMRTESSFTFTDEGVYLFTIEVKEAACPEPTKENEVEVTTEDIDLSEWPCVRLWLKLRSRLTGDLVPFSNPYRLRFSEKYPDGSRKLVANQQYTQLDSILIVRLCLDPDKPGRNREIEIINENDDPDEDKDTTKIDIPVPLPDGDGDPVKFAWNIPGDWQMVSLPLNSTVTNPTALFNDPLLSIFYFNTEDGVYDLVSDMEFGKGYWIKSDGLGGTVYGLEQNTLTLEGLSGVGEPNGFGWNLVGAPSTGLAVSAITVAPAGGLKSIFGWDPNVGYIIPTTIEPGKGHWVRVEPNTKLVMHGTSFAGTTNTTYSKIIDRLDIAGMLQISSDGQGMRPLYLSATTLRAEERDNLALPAPPPGVGFDVRTDDQLQYLFPGDNTLRIHARGEVRIGVPTDMPRVTIEILTADGRELSRFTGSAGEFMTLRIADAETVLLRVSVRSLSTTDMLGANYPNPFQIGGETWIPYTLQQDSYVRLAIYDVLGRCLTTLVSSLQRAGDKLVSWNGRDSDGEILPAGMYIYRLETAAGIVTRTLSIVR